MSVEKRWSQEVVLIQWEEGVPKVAILKNGSINAYDLRKQTFDKFADVLLSQEPIK